MSLNNFCFCGRLTADPEVRYSSGAKQTAIASMTVAVNRDFKRDGDPDTDFIKCVAFGKTAESIEKYLTKGIKVICVGSVQNNNYEKDGVKHYSFQVVLNRWEFAESRKSAAESGETETKPEQGDGFMNIPSGLDIDMPFA